jgi:hypothetical protein
MVAKCDDLVSVGECAQPGIKVINHARAFGKEGEVSGVKQQIAGRDDQLAVKLVGICQAHDAHLDESTEAGIEPGRTL